MQRHTTSPRTRLRPGLRRGLTRASALPAALLTASSLLLAAAPASVAQSGGWEHYEIGEPRVITLNFDTDLLAWDLCWSDHTAMARTQVANAAVAQMNDPARLYVIDMPGLPPFYRRTSNAPIWYDLVGEQITSNNVLPNRWNYHLDVEQALIDIAAQIREHRPGAKLAFKNFEVQPLHNRPAAYTELGEVQDFYITDRTIYLNHVGHMLNHALNSAFYRARVDFANEANNWLVFPDSGGKFALASNNGLDWPPAEFEPEILALWGGDDEPEGGGPQYQDGDLNDFPLILPGTGWSGPTEQPSPIGSPSANGYDATAIARWDVVPHQVIDEPFTVGIVAFHMNEIDRVEFSAEGGPWVAVDEMKYNPRTQVWEYTALIDPAAYLDGQIEVRAIAYPEVGTPRVLEPLVLYTNAGGSIPSPEVYVAMSGNDQTGDGTRENPFKTIWRAILSAGPVLDNVTVFLEPGVYEYKGDTFPQPSAGIGWTTIAPAPGVSRDDVQLVRGERRIRVDKIRLKDLTLDQSNGWQIISYADMGWDIWLDRVRGEGQDQLTGSPFGSGFANVFVTDSQFSRYRDGMTSATLVRGVELNQLGSDAFQNVRMVVNSSVDTMDRLDSSMHPDVFQLFGPSRDMENIILYNVKATRTRAQGIFVSGVQSLRDFAVVNVSIDKEDGVWTSQIGDVPIRHMVFRHVSIPNMTWGWGSDDIQDVSIVGCLWRKVILMPANGNSPVLESTWFRHNHFIDGSSFGAIVLGADASVGDAQLVESALGEFSPAPISPLRSRVPRMAAVDMNGNERATMSTIGALD